MPKKQSKISVAFPIAQANTVASVVDISSPRFFRTYKSESDPNELLRAPRSLARLHTAFFYENLGLQILRFTFSGENWQKDQLPEKAALMTLPLGSACSNPEYNRRQQQCAQIPSCRGLHSVNVDYAIGLDGGGVYMGSREAF